MNQRMATLALFASFAAFSDCNAQANTKGPWHKPRTHRDKAKRQMVKASRRANRKK